MDTRTINNTQEAYHELITKVTVPLAVAVAVLLCSLLATLVLVADYQTSIAQSSQIKLAGGALTLRKKQIEKAVVDYSSWNQAVDHTDSRDLAWIDEEIGRPIFQNFSFDMTFVIAADGSTIYSMIEGNRSDHEAGKVLGSGLKELLAKARAAGHGAVSGLIAADGKPAIVAIAPIQVSTPDAQPAQDPDLLVFVNIIDEAMLREICDVYLLSDLKLVFLKPQDAPFVELTSPHDDAIGFLTWDGVRPGDALLQTSVPVWVFIGFTFALLSAAILRQARSTARMIAESEAQAKHDPLTGLPNRLLLFERLDAKTRKRLSYGPGFAVAYLDLDGFKPINDRYGHDAGDEVLRVIARRIRQTIDQDDCLARIGGDEFALILGGSSDRAEIATIAHAIISAVEHPILIKDVIPIMVSITIGVALAPEDGTDPLTLLRKADIALYEGKNGGKRQVRFYEDERKKEAISSPTQETRQRIHKFPPAAKV
ncbi:diguanylate cyclase domain-containing protein [Oryzifoliimicrobium ureilyticus]|uniref:diguanylate cyclase domain-containing protein n=1 Tax=Oryzifoliimicrobium ureilyticus TaxID=3113724 RepID=UPI00307671E4